MSDQVPGVAAEILDFYSKGGERERLDYWHGRLEFARTRELIEAELPGPPATVIDVGGAAGHYASWLMSLGHDVTLIDPVELHVNEALARGVPAEIGDARRIRFAEDTVDVALLLGPLYHLVDRSDRLLALSEVLRVLRPGGLVAASAVSRFSSVLAGLHEDALDDPRNQAMADRGATDGIHLPPPGTGWFTTAYFHRPEELEAEVRDAGFANVRVVGVEGTGWLIPPDDFERRWADAGKREAILWAARRIQEEPEMRGASSHLLCLARKAACE